MKNLLQDFGLCWVIFVGIICLIAVILLCSKTSKTASLKTDQTTDESNINISPENSIETLKVNALDESCKINIKCEDEILLYIDDSPTKMHITEDSLTKTEEYYAEINSECRPNGNYSSIQDVKQENNEEVTGISDFQKHDDSDYSTIDKIPDKVRTSYNPYSTVDGDRIVAPPTPKLRERKTLISNAVENIPDNSNVNIWLNVQEKISPLYAKVDKQKNGLNIEKHEKLKNFMEANRKTKSLENFTDYYPIKELNFLRNTVYKTLKNSEQKSKSPFEDLYSKINKNKHCNEERNCLTDALIQGTLRKSTSEGAGIYPYNTDNFKGKKVMDGRENTKEEVQTYEEINFK